LRTQTKPLGPQTLRLWAVAQPGVL